MPLFQSWAIKCEATDENNFSLSFSEEKFYTLPRFESEFLEFGNGLQSTPDNSNLLRKLEKVRAIGGSK